MPSWKKPAEGSSGSWGACPSRGGQGATWSTTCRVVVRLARASALRNSLSGSEVSPGMGSRSSTMRSARASGRRRRAAANPRPHDGVHRGARAHRRRQRTDRHLVGMGWSPDSVLTWLASCCASARDCTNPRRRRGRQPHQATGVAERVQEGAGRRVVGQPPRPDRPRSRRTKRSAARGVSATADAQPRDVQLGRNIAATSSSVMSPSNTGWPAKAPGRFRQRRQVDSEPVEQRGHRGRSVASAATWTRVVPVDSRLSASSASRVRSAGHRDDRRCPHLDQLPDQMRPMFPVAR